LALVLSDSWTVEEVKSLRSSAEKVFLSKSMVWASTSPACLFLSSTSCCSVFGTLVGSASSLSSSKAEFET
jgi:hypothetical protein